MQRTVRLLILGPALLLAYAMPAWALYKVVGPDGRVTYTDRAPVDRPSQPLKANGSAASTDGLPYELQRVVSRYPVTLYTGANCSPCDAARQALKTRGIPFVEKTIATSDDIKAYKQAEGTDQLPAIRIGQKQLQGFGQGEWNSYLDAAGYPAKSALPLNYRWPAPSAMVPLEAKPADGAASDAAPKTPPAGDGGGAPGSAPSGFRF
jgi:glutaredoxin